MSDQDLPSEDEEIGPVESDESDVGEVEENDSIQTLSSLKESLKNHVGMCLCSLDLHF